MVNPHIQKDNPKVVHTFDMEDLGDKAVVLPFLEVQKISSLWWISHKTQWRNWRQRGTFDQQGLCINLEGRDAEGDGREVQEGGDICIPMTDSCLTENKIL